MHWCACNRTLPERLLTSATLSEEESLAISESVDSSLFILSSSVTVYSCSIVISVSVALGAESGGSADEEQAKEVASSDVEGGCVAVWLGSVCELCVRLACHVLPDALTDDSLPGKTTFLHEISLDNDQQPTLSYPVQVLDKGVEVSGVVLLSAGSLCTIDQIRVNISIISPLTGR